MTVHYLDQNNLIHYRRNPVKKKEVTTQIEYLLYLRKVVSLPATSSRGYVEVGGGGGTVSDKNGVVVETNTRLKTGVRNSRF